jgi:hypothetical protein
MNNLGKARRFIAYCIFPNAGAARDVVAVSDLQTMRARMVDFGLVLRQRSD